MFLTYGLIVIIFVGSTFLINYHYSGFLSISGCLFIIYIVTLGLAWRWGSKKASLMEKQLIENKLE